MLLWLTQHNQIPEGSWCVLAGDPQQGLEGGHRRVAPVTAEDKLGQIALEISGFNSMMRPVEPGAQLAEHAMNLRSDLMGSLGGTDHSHSLCVTHQGLVGITRPAICSHR
jgi:hypothetical protein